MRHKWLGALIAPVVMLNVENIYTAELMPSQAFTITQAIKNGIYNPTSGVGAGIAASIVHVVACIFNGSVACVTAVLCYCAQMSRRGFNKLCCRPDPLDQIAVQCWYDLVEQIAHDLCDRVPSTGLMLRSLRVDGNTQTNVVDAAWRSYSLVVKHVFCHIHERIQEVTPYYKGGREQSSFLVAISHGMIALDRTTILFLLHEVDCTLAQITDICSADEYRQECSVERIRPLLNIVLLMLKKLHALITPATSQATGTKMLGLVSPQPSRIDALFP